MNPARSTGPGALRRRLGARAALAVLGRADRRAPRSRASPTGRSPAKRSAELQLAAGEISTGIPFSTALPESASSSVSSVSRFEFTPGRRLATARLRARRVVSVAVGQAHDAAHHRVAELDRRLDDADPRAHPRAAAGGEPEGAARRRGGRAACSAPCPSRARGRLCIHELFERRWRRPISTKAPLALALGEAALAGARRRRRAAPGASSIAPLSVASIAGSRDASGPRSTPCSAAAELRRARARTPRRRSGRRRARRAASDRRAAPARARSRGARAPRPRRRRGRPCPRGRPPWRAARRASARRRPPRPRR